jgi:Uma2 family endonuclease
MGWAELCADPLLQDLPYKVQTDRWGNILMSPATNEHGLYQAKIVALLSRLTTSGTLIVECAVQTRAGVKVADVAWASDGFMQRNRGQNPFSEAPELCVEILSPSNSEQEMVEKRELYFARGARECWIADQRGVIKFYNNSGPLEKSQLVTDFPNRVSL